MIFVAQATQFKHIKASMFVSIFGSLFGIDVTDKALACWAAVPKLYSNEWFTRAQGGRQEIVWSSNSRNVEKK